jgi:mRNA interferase MazF
VITSNESRTRSPGNVLVKKGEANLLRDSVVNITQVATVDKSELVERIGKLSAGTVDAIREGLHLLFDRM